MVVIIPIGLQSATATFKNEIQRTPTLPFDWMFATPTFVYEIFELLLVQNMDIPELVTEHFFCCDKRASLCMNEHYYTQSDGFALHNTKYNVIFPHDKNDTETIEKYIRRFERLKSLILHSTDCLAFVYSSQSSLQLGNFTIDGKNVVKDVYENLSRLYSLIGRFRDNYKMVVFDSLHEQAVDLLDENITLVKLNYCKNWSQLVSQMRAHQKAI